MSHQVFITVTQNIIVISTVFAEVKFRLVEDRQQLGNLLEEIE